METFDNGATYNNRDPDRVGTGTLGAYQADVFASHKHNFAYTMNSRGELIQEILLVILGLRVLLLLQYPQLVVLRQDLKMLQFYIVLKNNFYQILKFHQFFLFL